jgi:spermidine/putrescine transport system permease protein
MTFFLLYLPIASLVVFAFNAGRESIDDVWEGFSLRWFVKAGRTKACRTRRCARSSSPSVRRD